MSNLDNEIILDNNCVPIWRKFCLSTDEAAKYFHIGEERLRRLQKENPQANYLLSIGNRLYFKRKLFEEYINGLSTL